MTKPVIGFSAGPAQLALMIGTKPPTRAPFGSEGRFLFTMLDAAHADGLIRDFGLQQRWSGIEARIKERSRYFEEADAMLMETPLASIEPSREAAGVFLTLGDWNGIRLRTSMAADCYVLFLQANRLDRYPFVTPLAIAPTLVEAGKADEYELFRTEALARNESKTFPPEVASLIKGSLLMPADPALLARLRPHVERLTMILNAPTHPEAMGDYQSAFTALALAMMAYRSGDFQKALEWSARCFSYPDYNQARSAAIHAICAMATHRLGKSQQAGVELAQARELLAGPFNRDATFPRGEGNGVWYDWSIARVLEREATALVEGGAR